MTRSATHLLRHPEVWCSQWMGGRIKEQERVGGKAAEDVPLDRGECPPGAGIERNCNRPVWMCVDRLNEVLILSPEPATEDDERLVARPECVERMT
jgi:hypothetical protein